jgi:dTDP-4-dehydrorhamnose reductase
MKVLIIGADGMIGHKMAQTFRKNKIDIILNSRFYSNFLKHNFPKTKVYEYDFLNKKIENLLAQVNPDYIINAVGITIRRGANESNKTKYINTSLPHEIDSWCQNNNKKQIHFSTDCVFSGKKGNYYDFDSPDADDSYGKTKGLGEINSNNTLTIRSSMIGRELFNNTELLEWIIKNKNQKINGFDNAIYSGVTTLWMSKTVCKIIRRFPKLCGIWNVSSRPISKYELIKKINYKFMLNIDIVKDSSFYSNKSLNSSRFFSETNFEIPNWDDMLSELYIDSIENHNLYIQK